MIKLLTTLTVAAAALAAVPAAAAPTVKDGGFEAQGAASTSTGPGYCYFGLSAGNGICASGAWSGTSGLQREDNTAWPGAPTADGSYYGFVQGEGTLTQSVTLGGGRYLLNWSDAGRQPGCCGGNQTYTISVGDVALGAFSTVTGQQFGSHSVAFTLGAGTYDLTFTGTNPLGGDNTAYIDAVSLAGVPEPATWALMIMGFGAVGGAMRRRRQGVAAFA